MRKNCLLASVAFVATLLLHAATLCAQQSGGRAGTLLRSSQSAREIAMGGAVLSFDIDATAAFSLGAALTELERPSVAGAWSSPLFGIVGSATLAGAMPIAGSGAAGLAITTSSTGDQKGYDANRRSTGTIVDRELMLSASAAVALGPGSIGATLHLLRRDISGTGLYNTGYAFDLSGTLQFDERLFLGLMLNDLAGEVVGGGSSLRETVPWQARISAAYVHALERESEMVRPDPTGVPILIQRRPRSYLMAAASGRIVGDDVPTTYCLAAEAVPLSSVPAGLRFGVNSAGEISGGFFLRFALEFARDFRLDYAVRWYESPTDVTHHVGLSAGL